MSSETTSRLRVGVRSMLSSNWDDDKENLENKALTRSLRYC